jgi:hypothetical protein
VITEPTPVHDATHGHRAQTSGMGDREGVGAGPGASVPESHAGAAVPQPEATIAQPSAPPSLARRADGPMLAAPASPESDDLREDRRVIAAATEGPWTAHPNLLIGGHAVYSPGVELGTGAEIADFVDEANAAFIARARTRWPQLLDEVDELRVIELAALILLRASGPDASWGGHETADRVLRDLLAARGHDVGRGESA